MKIRMSVPAALFVASMFAGSALADGTIRFDSIGDGYRHWGGLFNFTLVSDSPTHGGDLGGGYSTGQWAGDQMEGGIGSSFATFCLETGEDLGHLGGYFRAEVGTSVDGGVGYDGWGGQTDTVLHAETAFLYSAFRHGTLTGVAGWDSDASTQANAVQGAIWLLQHQVDQDFVDNGTDGPDGAYSDAEVALIAELIAHAQTSVDGSDYWAGLGDVRVLNLTWGSDGSTTQTNQSVLALRSEIVPLPTPVNLASVGLLGVAGLTRRRIGR
ncbi:MAG: hypothetical protein IT436_13915 [Phycisphaerales bacterium]|nr:hypothetical protein [Phycisphaerales bacterium]